MMPASPKTPLLENPNIDILTPFVAGEARLVGHLLRVVFERFFTTAVSDYQKVKNPRGSTQDPQ